MNNEFPSVFNEITPRIGEIIDREKDSYSSYMNNFPMAVHFYYMNINPLIMGIRRQNLKPFSQSGMVMNFLYTPFIDEKDVSLIKIPYDQKNLGSVSDESTDPEADVSVFKIMNCNLQPKKLGSFTKYPKSRFERSEFKSPLNESKLWQFPYYYISINDYINSPLDLNPMFLKDIQNNVDVMVKQPVSITGGYTIYINNYKGDKNQGANEGLFSASGLDLPTSSTQYAQFMANNKNTFQAEQNISSSNEKYRSGKMTMSSIMTGVATAGGLLLAPATGGTSVPISKAIVAGAITTGLVETGKSMANNAGNYLDIDKQKKDRLEQTQAKLNDILSAPRNVNLSSGDILITADRNQRKIVANKYVISDYYKQKLCDYWTMFGYKQNKLMYNNINNSLITSRKYFNYIKTIDANIEGDELDKLELEQIKAIFDKGITFWHKDNGAIMYDYSKDNKEIY